MLNIFLFNPMDIHRNYCKLYSLRTVLKFFSLTRCFLPKKFARLCCTEVKYSVYASYFHPNIDAIYFNRTCAVVYDF